MLVAEFRLTSRLDAGSIAFSRGASHRVVMRVALFAAGLVAAAKALAAQQPPSPPTAEANRRAAVAYTDKRLASYEGEAPARAKMALASRRAGIVRA